jgi:hypothetical protein
MRRKFAICSFFVFVGNSRVAVLVFLGVRPLGGMVLFLGECVDVDMDGM